jgi:hypothetical protein
MTEPATNAPTGSLVVVGTGIRLLSEIPMRTRYEIQQADQLLYLVADPVTAEWLTDMNPSAKSLYGCYSDGSRKTAYEAMIELSLEPVRAGRRTCVAYYGHPGVFCYPGHEAVRRARSEGFRARMLPAVSAEDSLIADVGFDPGVLGCQSYEATDFLLCDRQFDSTVPLVLWQVAVVGDFTLGQRPNPLALRRLMDRLVTAYGDSHPVLIYEAAQFDVIEPRLDWIEIAGLADASISGISTLFVPPRTSKDPDSRLLQELGLSTNGIRRSSRALMPWWPRVIPSAEREDA